MVRENPPDAEQPFGRVHVPGLLELSNILQRLDRHRDNVGSSPGRRNSYPAGRPLQTLGEYVADDRRNASVAIDYRCSRGAVIDDKAVVAFIHLEQCGTSKPLAGSKLNEPSPNEMREAFRVDDCQDLLFRHQRLPANPESVRGENGTLELDDGKLFGLVPGQIAQFSGSAAGPEIDALFTTSKGTAD